MSATKYGNGNYGISDESGKGIYIQSLSMSATEEVVELPDHIGEVTGAVFYNSSATITGNGATMSSTGGGGGPNKTGQVLGGILDIASTAIYGDDTPVTKFYINSLDITDSNTDFQQGSFSAQGWAGVTASSGTEIT